jgi:NO-binding membrane sensor protein with MHYT domain/anti-sigma regulatory factor (Ser/Thr protein kinase)
LPDLLGVPSLVGYYNYWLVLLSIVVAITASYVALDLTSRVVASHGHRSERLWLFGGAASMGSGIWSMHFIGMLAFRMPVTVSYDLPITSLSLLIAVAASGFALYVTSRGSLSLGRLLSGSSLLGLAIAAMHYTGMAAMRVLPPVHHDVGLVALSVVIAIGTSVVALWSAFNLRLETIFTAFWKKAGSAALMGGGICLMHYTGMAAAKFTPHSISTTAPQTINHFGLAVILGGFTLAFLMATLLVSALDAYYAQQSAESAQRLHALNRELETRSAELSRINALLQQEVQIRTQAEEALRKARDELETRVIDRTQALRASEQQLRRLFEEREDLSRDLHDNIVQSIYGAGLNLEQIALLIREDPTQAAAEVAVAIGDLNGVIRDIRRYIDGPAEQTSATLLRDSLAKLVDASRPDSSLRFLLEVDAAADAQLTPEEAEQVLQIAREAMSNARRHSHAKHGMVSLQLTDDGVSLEVTDDGDGFDPAGLKHEGSGLYNMKARAQQIRARLEVLSSPGKGTRIVVHISRSQKPT